MAIDRIGSYAVRCAWASNQRSIAEPAAAAAPTVFLLPVTSVRRLSFDDLHSSGIYSWQYLHDLGTQKLSRMRRYDPAGCPALPPVPVRQHTCLAGTAASPWSLARLRCAGTSECCGSEGSAETRHAAAQQPPRASRERSPAGQGRSRQGPAAAAAAAVAAVLAAAVDGAAEAVTEAWLGQLGSLPPVKQTCAVTGRQDVQSLALMYRPQVHIYSTPERMAACFSCNVAQGRYVAGGR